MSTKTILITIIISVVACFITKAQVPYGEWRFDDATNLTKATNGYIDLAASGTGFSAIDGPTAEDGAVRIEKGSHYVFTHGLTPKTGETFINEYSILFDFKVPSIGQWYSFFQANGANTDDGELFVKNTTGTIGVKATGYSGKAITANQWYRLIVVVNNGTEYSLYLDGEKILTGTVQSVDSRFGLRESILLFGDNNGEDGTIDVARVSVYNSALTQTDVTNIGFLDKPYNPYLTKPYLQNVTPTGITVMWETIANQTGTIKYSKTTTFDSQTTSSITTTNALTYVHKAVLTNLEPNTQYFYKVEAEGVESDTQSFITAPDNDNAPFSVGIWGDSHHVSPWQKMADYMVNNIQPNFAFNSGDICYSRGNSRDDLATVFLPHVCERIGSRIPFFSSLGNHDVAYGGEGGLITQFHDFPKSVNSDPIGFVGSYLMMYSNVAFISIDWNKMETDILPGAWLETVLKSNDVQNARFRLVFIHNAPYYERWQVAENNIIKANLPALCSQYKVDAVFSGHMHGYERGFLNGVSYITQGGASYMDTGESVGTTYDHIIRGTDKPENPANFNNGLTNHLLSLHVEDNTALIKLHYFSRTGDYLGIIETIDLSNIVTSANSIEQSRIQVVNNNHTGLLSIKGEDSFTIELFDINGNCIKSDPEPSLVKQVNTSGMKTGVYIISINTRKGLTNKKIYIK